MASHTPVDKAKKTVANKQKVSIMAMSFSESLGELRAKDGYELMDLSLARVSS